MRALNIHGVGDLRLDPKPKPQAGRRDIVVKVRACGVCGSDLTYVKWGGINRAEGGVTPIGHEAAGEVIAVGEDVKGVHLGQRVVINPMNTPSFIGSGGPEGAFSDAVLVGDARVGTQAGDNLLPIADDVPFDIAALTEPLSVALHGVNRAQARRGDKVVVFGCGPIGLGMVLWLVERGADVIAVDLVAERLQRAAALGANAVIDASRGDVSSRIRALHGSHRNFLGNAVANTDAYIDAAGGPDILGEVIPIARFQARYVVTAAHSTPVSIDLGALLVTEMTITSALGYPTEMPEVLAALPRLQEKLGTFITHRFDFGNVLEGFATAADPLSNKVMIEFGKDLA